MQRKTLLAALIAILNGTTYQAHAYSVTVVASRPVEQQVVPRMEAIKGVLSDILSTQTATGTAINQNSEKLASVIAQNGQATRQQMIFSNETQRLEEARKSFTVPDSICSESASGIATESKNASASAASKLSKGGGVSNRSIRDRLASAANSPVREAYDGAAIHASYCTEAEYARFGGTAVCPSVGEIPGGDSQVRSIYHGAGTADTPAALTWDQKQQKSRLEKFRQVNNKKAQLCLSWEEALQASHMSVDDLDRRFRRRRTVWRFCCWSLLAIALFLSGMLFDASSLPLTTLVRAISTLVLILSGVALCASRALIVTYRLWQLHERKVSEPEQGTFRDFLNDRNGWRNATLIAVTSKQY